MEGIVSILDQDLYKFCMQLAVREHYPNVYVKYAFTNRDKSMKFNKAAYNWFVSKVSQLETLSLREDEFEFLKTNCTFLNKEYLNFLKNFRFFPKKQIFHKFIPDSNKTPSEKTPGNISESTSLQDLQIFGDIELTVEGIWSEVILYEIPLLALISESYFKFVDTDWSIENQEEIIRNKAILMLKNNCVFSEFGTRRRRSFEAHDIIVRELSNILQNGYKEILESSSESNQNKPQSLGKISGTSNVFLAKKYNMAPVGTVGHEWTMGVAALEKTFDTGNKLALYKWHATFKGSLGIALTDTFGIKSFFLNFDQYLSRTYTGLRHDSGDPNTLIDLAIKHYKNYNIDPKTKVVVFSDGLNVEKAIHLQKQCESKGIGSAFGIGTTLTNDFKKSSDPNTQSKAMNIVIKLIECGGDGCVKLSDDPGKHSGLESDIKRALEELDLME
ncbi:hypothetical protein BB559_005446 [Furculomyces boomerangus]|uniref:Nicotinate phosphoribosyltransferase n=2 Tax=Harpellales TaxID=61421 RepID=A0A2T9Y8M9_9FUNG|nr:hypothetical protein BB559_005446 [Furculomyces boomerangus]PWA01107.1 hypothetical protein BB558_002833 [Smittium angustum]